MVSFCKFGNFRVFIFLLISLRDLSLTLCNEVHVIRLLVLANHQVFRNA